MRILRTGVASAILVLCLLAANGAQAQPVTAAAGPGLPELTDYKLGPGDKVRVTVFGEPSLSGEFFVASNGQVSLPLVGEIPAGGSTVNTLQARLQKLLSDGYLKEPRVSAEILTYRPFFILGEVQKPGQYPYTAGLTVQNAVATAGGFTYRANKKKVWIKHSEGSREQAYAVGSATSVAPGDTIRVGERLF